MIAMHAILLLIALAAGFVVWAATDQKEDPNDDSDLVQALKRLGDGP